MRSFEYGQFITEFLSIYLCDRAQNHQQLFLFLITKFSTNKTAGLAIISRQCVSNSNKRYASINKQSTISMKSTFYKII